MAESGSTPPLSRRRRASRSLSKLSMPSMDETDAPPPIEEVQEESRELFQHFMYSEIERQGINPTASNLSPTISTPQGYANPAWAKAGKKLRIWADEFEKTKDREKVRREAHRVEMEEMNEIAFSDLLSEAFSGNITESHVLFVFFFCSDLAIRALKEKLTELFSRLLNWSMQFISNKVSQWVQQHGGWSAVLSRSYGYAKLAAKVGVIGILAVISFVAVRYAYRKITSS